MTTTFNAATPLCRHPRPGVQRPGSGQSVRCRHLRRPAPAPSASSGTVSTTAANALDLRGRHHHRRLLHGGNELHHPHHHQPRRRHRPGPVGHLGRRLQRHRTAERLGGLGHAGRRVQGCGNNYQHTADTTPPPPTPVGEPLNRPTNPGLLMYADGAPPANVVANWSRPGALVVVGRTNYDEPWVHTMADGGATVLIYLDSMIDNDWGRYHDKLINASEFGPPVPRWPGHPSPTGGARSTISGPVGVSAQIAWRPGADGLRESPHFGVLPRRCGDRGPVSRVQLGFLVTPTKRRTGMGR